MRRRDTEKKFKVKTERNLQTAVNLLKANDPGLRHLCIESYDENEATAHLKIIAAHLGHHLTHLQEMDIDNFGESDELNEEIAALIRQDIPCLQKICLQSNGVCDVIAGPLLENSHIKTLQLFGCEIGDDGAEILAGVLRNPRCNLEQLILSFNCIGNRGCSAIMEALPCIPSLKALDLSFNWIDAEGCQSIANALQNKFVAVEELKLDLNSEIGDDGCICIANALNENTSLRSLFLGECCIGVNGWDSMELTLQKKNFALRELIIDDDASLSKYRERFQQLLAFNKQKPVESKAKKTGKFPHQLFISEQRDISFSASCDAEMLTKVISYDNLSVVFSFIKECPSLFDL